MSGSTASFYRSTEGAEATPLELFASSYLQDSGLVRGAANALASVRQFGLLGPAPVEGYSPFRDESLRPFLVEHSDSMHLFTGSRSPEESAFIQDRVRQMKAREEYLSQGGAYWTRMLAGALSPEAIATLPFGIGELTAATRLGRAAQAAGRTAALNAGTAAAENLLERGSLPESIQSDFVGDVALATLFGAALGGLAGSVSGRSIDRAAARHAATHDAADGLRTPGVEPVPLRTAAHIGDAPAGRLTPEGEAAATRLIAEIMGPGARFEVGALPEGWNAASVGHVVRFGYQLGDEAVPTIARHEAIHGLRTMGLLTADEWSTLARAAEREGWLDKHRIADRYPDLDHAARIEEAVAEQFARWATASEAPAGPLAAVWAKVRDFFDRLLNGLRGAGFQTAEDVFARIEGGEVGRRAPDPHVMGPEWNAWVQSRLDLASETMFAGRAHVGDPAGPTGGGGGSDPQPAGSDPASGRSDPAAMRSDPPAAKSDPAAAPALDSQRIAPGSGARAITWRQLPYYVLKNNPFTGAVGEAVARWASELVQDPGLRMEGVNQSASVEALTKQGGVRFAAVSEAMDRLYYQHAGWDPASATPARARIEEARQRLPGSLGAVPEGKMTMAEFNDAVFRSIAGEKRDTWPREVAEAAREWQAKFFGPYERELAEAGVVLSGTYKAESHAAVTRSMEAREARMAHLERWLARDEAAAKAGQPGLSAEVRDRLNLLLDRERGAQAMDGERLKALADMKSGSEPYVFHTWLRGKVAEQRGTLVGILARHWDGERPRGSWAPGAVRAEIAISHLLRDSVPDTLEAAIARHLTIGGLEEGLARARAAELAAPARALVAEMAPSRLGVEIRSALAWREDHGPIKGLAKLVREALEYAGLDPKTHDGKLMREIVGEAGAMAPTDFGDRARPGHAKEREIDVPTRLIADFLDTSMKQGGADYARRMGAAIEMSRSQGDPSMLGRLAAMEMALLVEVAAGRGTLAQVDDVLEAARASRDKVLGNFRIPEDPSAYSLRALRFLSNTAIMAQMGSALWSNIADLGRVVMAHGLTNVLGAAYQAAVVDRAAWRLAGDEARKAGVALEITLLARQRELQQLHDIAADASLIERLADQGAKATGFVNLVAPWTELMQRFSGALHQSEMVELSLKATRGTLAEAERARMHHYGIDDAMAARIADAWQAAGAERRGALHLANTDAWADPDLVRTFRAQLTTATDASVMRPGAADRPNFMSAQLWQTTLLYKSFSIAASQRLVMAGMQQRDGRVLSGMLASASLAWLIGGATAGPYDDHPILSPERLFQAIDRSGVLGIIGDLNNATEMATANAIGLRPLLQLNAPIFAKDPNWAQRVGAVAGPAIQPWLSAVWAFTDPAAKGDQVAGAIRRLLPFNNLIWLGEGFRAVQREAGTGIDWLTDDGAGQGRAIDLPGYVH